MKNIDKLLSSFEMEIKEILTQYHKFLDWENKDDEGEISNNVDLFLKIQLKPGQKPYPSDEEIEDAANKRFELYDDNNYDVIFGFKTGAKWMRDNYQLKYDYSAENLVTWLEDYPSNVLADLVKKHGISKVCEANGINYQPKQIDWDELKYMEYKELFNILNKIGKELQERQYSTAPNDFIKAAIDVCIINSNKN